MRKNIARLAGAGLLATTLALGTASVASASGTTTHVWTMTMCSAEGTFTYSNGAGTTIESAVSVGSSFTGSSNALMAAIVAQAQSELEP